MTNKQFLVCCQEIDNYRDKDAYRSDIALSSVWGDDPNAEISQDRMAALGDIWDACHRSIKDIAAEAGLSQRKLAERFYIPYRTVEDWASGRRTCPVYVRLMMQEILGLLKR